MKKFTFSIIIALLGLTACSEDQVFIDEPTIEPTLGNNYRLNVSLQLPGTEAVPYSNSSNNGYDIATHPETIVETLDVYMFGQTGDDDNFYLEKTFIHGQNLDVANESNFLTFSLSIKGSGEKHFYFIANKSTCLSSLKYMTLSETTEEEFNSYITDNVQQSVPLLMTAYSEITTEQFQNANINSGVLTLKNMALERLNARIDLENSLKTLTIDSVQLQNTPAKSYISNKSSTKLKNENTIERIDLPVVKIQQVSGVSRLLSNTGLAYENENSIYIPSLYYPYEETATDNTNTSRLKIWGRLNATNENDGNSVMYELPLTAVGNENVTNSIVRNHRYIVHINDASTNGVNYSFNVNNWISDKNDTIHFVLDAGVIKVSNSSLKNKTLTAPASFLSSNDSTFVISVSANTKWSVNAYKESLPDWIEISEPMAISSTGESTIAGVNDIGDFFTLKIKQNTEIIREASIIITSNADKNTNYIFTVQQQSNI